MNPTARRPFLLAAGALFVLPHVAAQQPSGKVTRIGLLVTGSVAQRGHLEQALVDGLREQGLVEGTNLVIERRYADGQRERMPVLARELGALNLDAVVTTCTPTTRAARQATAATPIVMAAVADPVGQRLIASLARPGSTITGLSSQAEDILPKMMELFASILSRPSTVAVFLQDKSDVHPRFWHQLAPIALALDLKLQRVDVADAADLTAAFERALRAGATAAFFLPDEPLFLNQRASIVALASRHRLPALYGSREFVDQGGLMSYGESLRRAYRGVATYIGHLSRGAVPADLPVEQPTKFELVVNSKTARALGITLPQTMLLRADDVLE
jgi:putative tryptophan/tyrosine transport system substrate-binding protein